MSLMNKTHKPTSLYEFRKKISNYKDSRKQKLYSLVGSPDYMAIELLLGEGSLEISWNFPDRNSGYDFSIDWWSVGVMAFELIAGISPFFGETPVEVFAKIQNYQGTLAELKEIIQEGDIIMSEDFWDLIDR